jgi:hypothetical protein
MYVAANSMTESRKIAVYLAIVFALAYPVEFFIVAHGGVGGPAIAGTPW